MERFKRAWASPDLDAHRALWHPSVRLVQPMMKTTCGKDESAEQFGAFFDLIPDLRAEVHRWSGGGDLVFIEFTLRGTVGGTPIEWPAVDRFLLLEGQIAERVSYFDGTRLALAILTRPTGWRRWLRSGLRPSRKGFTTLRRTPGCSPS